MTKDEALKMAIEEIEGWIDHAYGHSPEECADNKTIMACKEALEQPEGKEFFERGKEIAQWADKQAQEPVAHIKQGMNGYPKLVFNGTFKYDSIAAKQPDIALYIKENL
jgi:hypothetical protein